MPADLITSRIDYYNKRLSGMDRERSSFINHYKELSDYIKPRRGRFFISDRNKGEKRHQSIINSIGTQALRVATAGMLAGTMSPSRPWFALESFNPDLMESQAVRDYLFKSELVLRAILNESNFYSMAPVLLNELLMFSTGCMTHVDDFEDVARFYTHTAGSYYIAQNDRLDVDTLVREFEWPVRQIVSKFGIENVSSSVKSQYDRGNYENWFPVTHFIEPNENFKPSSKRSVDKPFISVYYEPGNKGADKDKFLSMSGFDTFPAYVPRWDVTEGDIYGVDCPGMTALGDIKQLQNEEKEKAKGIQKQMSPPLKGPPTAQNIPVSGLPGGLTVYDGDDQRQKLEPIFQVQPQLQELRADMDAVERRINSAFFVDLFLAISNMEGIQPRNQLDLAQRNEERLLQLGPVLERLHGDFLTKLIDRLFSQAAKADILPPAPPELQGSPLRIRFISTLAMAQKAVMTADIERLTAYVSGLVGMGKEDALDKFNADQAIDEYSRAIGIPPKVVVSDEDVSTIREQRNRQLQLAQTIENAQTAATAAKAASDAKTDDRNVLTDLAGE